MAFIQAKAIKVYYTKGDRKPYDVNGKPLSYLGQESIGANIATQVRFYLGEDLSESITPIVVTKRADGDRHFDILAEGTDTEVTPNQKYYYVDLSNWYAEKVGKLTMALKVYSGTVTIEDDEITASTGRIVVSDIFHIDVAYAPDASDLVPPFDPDYFEELLEALANKVERQEVIQLVNTLPTVSSADDGKWFLLRQTNGGRLYRVLGGVAVEVETEMGQLKLTPTGNGEVTTNTGQVAWEEENGTAKLGLYNDVVLHLGEDVMYYAKAQEVLGIAKGDVVQFGGWQGNHALIRKAVPSEINAFPKLIMGIAKQDIANNEFGYVLAFGKLENVDTKGYTNGTLIWFDSASGTGQWTNVVPTAPNAKVLLAVVVKQESASLANNGVILVRPTFESKLDDLQNVLIASPDFGDVLRLDGTGAKWVNSNALTTAESDIDTLQSDVIGLDNTKADTTYVDSQDTNLSNRITFIETNGGIDFIKVANFASLPSSGDVRNHRLFITQDTNKLYEFDGTSFNEVRQDKLTADNGVEDGLVEVDFGTRITHSGTSDATALQVLQTSTVGDGNIIEAYNDVGLQFAVNKNGSVNAYSDLTIAGNLTVSGTTTTVNTATLDVEDNIITINKNQTGTPETTLLSGIEVERGSETNFQFVFQESSDLFKVGQVGDLQAVATREDSPTDKGVAFFNTSTNKFETSANLKVNASGQLVDTTIRNSATNVVPLVVDGVASTTARLQEWKVNGSNVATLNNGGRFSVSGIANLVSTDNSTISTTTTGTQITRNIADANPSLIVNNIHASSTGNIANFQWQGTNRLEITKDGFLNQNGTRLFSQPTNTTNVFFGTTSGGTSTSGSFNSSFGSLSLQSITSGLVNTAMGYSALSALTTGASNVSIGADSGRTITSGGSNTFVGFSAGFNASQLATASNSTALGNGSFTDKSNQMVFGNASVSEFKFDRNASATLLAPRITSLSSTSLTAPQVFVENTNTSSEVSFGTKNDSNIITAVGSYGSTKATYGITGSNDSFIYSNAVELNFAVDNANGTIKFGTGGSGSTERMRITNAGNVGIGTTTPASIFHANANVASSLPATSGTTQNGLIVRLSNALQTSGILDIGSNGGNGVWLQSTLSSNLGDNRNLLLNPNGGNVGIGTTTPGHRLHVNGSNGGLAEFSGVSSRIVMGADGNGGFIRPGNIDRLNFLNSSSANVMTINGTNIGIGGVGATTPLARLVVAGNDGFTFGGVTPTNVAFQVSNSNINYGMLFATAANGQGYIQQRRNDTTEAYYPLNLQSSGGATYIGSANGLVGINETSPSAQLQVKSGAIDRVPLIVDTLVSHTGLLQSWRVNGGTLAYVTNGGRFASKDGIQNNISPNNSYVITDVAGTTIYRDVNDSNPALRVNQQNASSTGDIVQFRRASVTQATIARDGIANFTGTPSNEQTGDYTLVLADKGKVLRVNSSSNRTITIPLNSSVAFPIDTEIALIRYGSGTVSISPTSGVTLNSVSSNRKVKDQYGSCALKKIGTDEWVLVGSLEA